VQRPIPIWFGGTAEAAIKRAAKVADGWFPQYQPDENGRAAIEQARDWVREAARDPNAFGLEPRIESRNSTDPEIWGRELEGWKDIGVSHVSINTMYAGHASPSEHIEALRKFAAVAKDFRG
jgi:hypothetical protein